MVAIQFHNQLITQLLASIEAILTVVSQAGKILFVATTFITFETGRIPSCSYTNCRIDILGNNYHHHLFFHFKSATSAKWSEGKYKEGRATNSVISSSEGKGTILSTDRCSESTKI